MQLLERIHFALVTDRYEWEKFVKPEDLIKILSDYNLKLDDVSGLKFNLFNDDWNLSSDNSVNYIAKFIKN